MLFGMQNFSFMLANSKIAFGNFSFYGVFAFNAKF